MQKHYICLEISHGTKKYHMLFKLQPGDARQGADSFGDLSSHGRCGRRGPLEAGMGCDRKTLLSRAVGKTVCRVLLNAFHMFMCFSQNPFAEYRLTLRKVFVVLLLSCFLKSQPKSEIRCIDVGLTLSTLLAIPKTRASNHEQSVLT